MTPLTLLMLTLLILFISALIRSTVGFGDALIAMPLLTLVLGVQTATPLVALTAVTIALTIVGSSWRKIDVRTTWRLILASIVGIPLGLLLLKTAPEALVKGFLGILIILFSLYQLTRPALPALNRPNWAYGFGFIAGILGGAYNTNGPPVVIYGALHRWPPVDFRATLQGYFLPTATLIALGHGLAGMWTTEVLQTYALALPFILLAIFMGGRLNARIPANRFEPLLYITLIILGLLLLL